MTAHIAPTDLDTPSTSDYWYDPDHHKPARDYRCYCGERAAGRTYYGRGRDWPNPRRTIYHCPAHLPTTPAAYTVVIVDDDLAAA